MRLLVLLLAFLTSACVPKIYVIDRQTVLEDEAAGEWPEYEKRLIPQVQQKMPVPSAQERNSDQKRRLYKVLNGDVVAKEATK